MLSEFNSEISEGLLSGCNRALLDKGVNDGSISVLRVPGAFELPAAAAKLAKHEDIDGVVALGAVIKGETTHDQYINQQVSHSLGQLAIQYGKPVLFGLLTCNNMEQAIHRAGGNVGNKGEECAQAALEMVSVLRQIDES